MTSGVLVIDKPQGPTSHDMVAVARRALGERRIGHCGTLDPMATGVLVLAIGQATRLAQFLSADEKTYEATIRFGQTTTTYDVMGDVTSTSPERPTREALDLALARFHGRTNQTPPAYSAKMVDGTRAYDLARRGAAAPVRLAPAAVEAFALDVIAFDGDTVTLVARVSAGFYVRSLAHDLGVALGMGAVLSALRRTRSGDFGQDEAVSTETLAGGDRRAVEARIIPMARLLPDVPQVDLTADDAARVRRGLDLPAPSTWARVPTLARLMNPQGALVALAVPAKRPGFLHPSIVLG